VGARPSSSRMAGSRPRPGSASARSAGRSIADSRINHNLVRRGGRRVQFDRAESPACRWGCAGRATVGSNFGRFPDRNGRVETRSTRPADLDPAARRGPPRSKWIRRGARITIRHHTVVVAPELARRTVAQRNDKGKRGAQAVFDWARPGSCSRVVRGLPRNWFAQDARERMPYPLIAETASRDADLRVLRRGCSCREPLLFRDDPVGVYHAT